MNKSLAIAGRTSLAGGCVLLSTLLAVPANAAVDEITVFAQKREQSLIDVPISMTVFSGDQLDKIGANDLRDLDGFIPNVIQTGLDSNINPVLSIRGIGSDNRNIGFESGASMYVDGVFVGRNFAFMSELTDVERLEVLRGPQGTLFGKNTIAGALNVFTKLPGDEIEGHAEIQYGNFDFINTRASLSGPIVEGVVSASISGFYKQRDGFQTNLLDGKDYWDEDQYGGRAKLRIQPNESLDIVISVDAMSEQERPQVATESVGLFGAPVTPIRDEVNFDAPAFVDREIYGGSVSWDLTLGNGATITSITGYRNNDLEFISDDDATPLNFLFSNFIDKEENITQELRYTSPDEGPFTYVVGFYYYHQDITTERSSIAGPPLTGAPVDLAVTLDAAIKTNAYAVFGQFDWDITDALTLTGGLRYTNDERDLNEFDLMGLAPFGIATFMTTRSIENDAFSFTAGLSYQVTDSLNTYVKASRGFKSGGFNADFVGIDTLEFDPEFALAYEGGVKFEGFDNRLRANIAGFYTDYKDLQVSQFSGDLGGFFIDNAASAEIWGFELDLTATPFDGLDIISGIGFQDATFEEFVGTGGDLAGNRLADAPKWTVSIAGQYTHQLDGLGSLFIRGEYAYRSDFFVDPDNAANDFVDGYSLLNGRIGYVSPDEHWQIEFWAKNLTDNEYLTGRDNPIGGLLGQQSITFGAPRTYGVRVVGRL